MKINYKKILPLIIAGTLIPVASKVGTIIYENNYTEEIVKDIRINSSTSNIDKMVEELENVSLENDERELLNKDGILSYIKYYSNIDKPDDYLEKLISRTPELEVIALDTYRISVMNDLNLDGRPVIENLGGYYFITEEDYSYAFDAKLNKAVEQVEDVRVFAKDNSYSYLLESDILTRDQFINTCETLCDTVIVQAISNHELGNGLIDKKTIKTKTIKRN